MGMTEDPRDPAGGEESLQYVTENFNEDEFATDEAEGEDDAEMGDLNSGFEEDGGGDSDLDDAEDDDFYDLGEFSDDDYGSGGDSGF